jgi:hypothetical protein
LKNPLPSQEAGACRFPEIYYTVSSTVRIPILVPADRIDISRLGFPDEQIQGIKNFLREHAQLCEKLSSVIPNRKYPAEAKVSVVEGHWLPVAELAVDIANKVMKNEASWGFLEAVLNITTSEFEEPATIEPDKIFKIAASHDLIETVYARSTDADLLEIANAFLRNQDIYSRVLSLTHTLGEVNGVNDGPQREDIILAKANIKEDVQRYAMGIIYGGPDVWIPKLADMIHNRAWDASLGRRLGDPQAKTSLEKSRNLVTVIRENNPAVGAFFDRVLEYYGYPFIAANPLPPAVGDA